MRTSFIFENDYNTFNDKYIEIGYGKTWKIYIEK